MARNDVFLNINALSPADAVVTGQQDMTAATVPELVLGDTPTFNFYFTDNTNVWPSWAGNASYTLTWALSDAVAGDFAPAATTGNATPITGGWSVILPLNSYDLVGLLNTKRVGQPYPVQNLWQQLRVTDPSGNEVTRAMFWTPVRYRAISDTQNTESASPTGGRFVTVNNVNTLTTPTAAQFYAANPVPTSALGTAANGELLIGNGTGFTKSTLTAGTGITVTNGSGSITIDASGAQETLTATVKNAESVAITKGQVVYLFGATGNMPSVKLAYNTSDATSAKTFGVVSDTSIAPNGTGTVTCVGVVDGLNLGAYQDGDTVYLGATPGSFTATKPYAPNHLVYVGIIERANAGNGELYVRVQNGYELDEIHDVQINSPRQSGQTLIYDNTTSLWKNARITAGSNIAVTNGDGSISIGFSGTLPVANGGTGVTTSTGSGSVVLSTSPTLTTPILGTPQSGTLSSCTGLPISTGVSGLGTNVATFLATPSSANLASAVTDETGTGALVFANTPTLVTPNIGAATGTSFNLTGSGTLGTTLTVNGTTDSSSKDTGAIVTEGGLGVEKSATFGGNLTVSGTGTSTFSSEIAANKNASNISFAANGSTPKSGIWTNNDGTMEWSDYATGTHGLSVNMTNGATVVSGNLTVSGTGTSSVAGNVGIGTTSPAGKLDVQSASAAGNTVLFRGGSYTNIAFATGVRFVAPASTLNSNRQFRFTSGDSSLTIQGIDGSGGDAGDTTLLLQPSGGNLLIGTSTDSGNGKLQLATHTTSAGGIGFGSDTSLYRSAAGQLRGPSSFIDATFASSGLFFGASMTLQANDNVLIKTNGSVTALTLDTSQNATFAGTILTATNAAKNAIVARYNSSNSLFGVTVNSAGQGVISENNDASTGSDKYSKTGLPAFRLGNTGGSGTVPFWIDVAASGTAGNAITWTNAFQIDSSQNATFAGQITASGISHKLGSGGTGAANALLTIDGSSASNYGSYIVLQRNSTNKWQFGTYSGINGGTSDDFLLYNPTAANEALKIAAATSNATFAGSIAIGNTVNTVSPTSPNRTITMVIGGTTYYIHAKTTND
jgi:hypothetical protein